MEFYWSWWIVMVVLGLCAIGWLLAMTVADGVSRMGFTAIAVVLFLIAGVVWNGATAIVSSADGALSNDSYQPQEQVNDRAVSEAFFGFKSGKAYPLVLGAQVADSQLSAAASTGFFSATAETSISGGTAITVAFTYSDTTYTLSLPRNATPIRIDDNKEPHVIVRIRKDSYEVRGYRQGSWSDCRWVISNLAIACKRTLSYEDKVRSHTNIRDTGLGTLVAQSFASAEITMTQAMYDQLIGRIR